MKINNFRGELTDISAKKEALVVNACCFSLNVSIREWTRLDRTSELHFKLKQTIYRIVSCCKITSCIMHLFWDDLPGTSGFVFTHWTEPVKFF